MDPQVIPIARADCLVVHKNTVTQVPQGYKLAVQPWTVYQGGTQLQACSVNRDYHGQPKTDNGGSGVLIAPDLVMTARHVVTAVIGGVEVDLSANRVFVFDFGAFIVPPQMTCGPDGACWVMIPTQNLARGESMVYAVDDLAIVRLTAPVIGRTPIPVRMDGMVPTVGEPIAIIGHPDHIPMKVERLTVTGIQYGPAGPKHILTDGHVTQGSSGSLVYNLTTGLLEGIVGAGGTLHLPDCANLLCYRQCFAESQGVTYVEPVLKALPYLQ